MKICQFFRNLCSKKNNAAAIAKERLQIIVSHESARHADPGTADIMKQLQAELIAVISKYIHVDQDLIKVQLERNGDHSVLELNVTLPEVNALTEKAASA